MSMTGEDIVARAVMTHLTGLELALAHGGGTHTAGDVVRQILDGDAQLFTSEDALIITEIHQTPRARVLHFWLATGELEAVIELSQAALDMGREHGCTQATLAGRKGWEKVLADDGWHPMVTVLGRSI